MEDPWTGLWEKLRVPKEEADYKRRREIPPQTLLLGRSRGSGVEEEIERRERDQGEKGWIGE